MLNRRHTLVVNRAFQYHYALLSVSVAIILLNSLIVVSVFFPKVFSLGGTLGWGQAITLAAIEVGMILGVWYASLRASRSIAGPMFAIMRVLNGMADGDLSTHVKLRKTDAFQEVGEALDGTLEKLRDRVRSLEGTACALRQQLGNEGEAGRLADALCQELASLKTEPPRDDSEAGSGS